MPELCLGQECFNRCLRDRFTIGKQATICKVGLFILCVEFLHERQDPSFSFQVFLCKVVDDAEPGVVLSKNLIVMIGVMEYSR